MKFDLDKYVSWHRLRTSDGGGAGHSPRAFGVDAHAYRRAAGQSRDLAAALGGCATRQPFGCRGYRIERVFDHVEPHPVHRVAMPVQHARHIAGRQREVFHRVERGHARRRALRFHARALNGGFLLVGWQAIDRVLDRGGLVVQTGAQSIERVVFGGDGQRQRLSRGGYGIDLILCRVAQGGQRGYCRLGREGGVAGQIGDDRAGQGDRFGVVETFEVERNFHKAGAG